MYYSVWSKKAGVEIVGIATELVVLVVVVKATEDSNPNHVPCSNSSEFLSIDVLVVNMVDFCEVVSTL